MLNRFFFCFGNGNILHLTKIWKNVETKRKDEVTNSEMWIDMYRTFMSG